MRSAPLLALVLACPLLASDARAQADHAPGGEAVVVYSAGLDAAFPDPKDRNLLAALRLIDRRLTELPAELQGPRGLDQPIATAWQLFTGPMTLQVWADHDNQGGPPIAVQITAMPPGQGAAARLEQSLADSLTRSGLRFDPRGGLRTATTPGGPLTLGALNRAGQGVVFLGLNTDGDRPAPSLAFELPDNAKPIMGFHADFKRLQALIEGGLQTAGPEAAQVRAALERAGLVGAGALVIDAAYGHTNTHTVGRARFRGLRSLTANPDSLTFGKEYLRAVPQDAVWLRAASMDLRALTDFSFPGGEDPFEALAPIVGLNLRTEVLSRLGRRYLSYRAEATGGGGLFSTVALLDLADPAAIADANARLIARFNQAVAEPARGYIRIRSWRENDLDLFSLITPGLPIPVELTWAIAANRLIVAAGPGPLLAAVDQINSGKSSILDNKTFSEAVGRRFDSAVSLTYADAARMTREGYGILMLGASALSNAVRSPTDPDRQPAAILPSFAELTGSVRPMTSIGRWDGDDLVIESRADRSALVNAAAASGALGAAPALAAAGIAAGAIMPALTQARESARDLKSAAQVRQMCMAVNIYAAENQDRLPGSFDLLTDYLGDPAIMISPLGPASDGGPDYALRSDLPDVLSRIPSPADTIIVVDRAAFLAGHTVAVGFLDGHVQQMQPYELMEALDTPANQGAAESLGLP